MSKNLFNILDTKSNKVLLDQNTIQDNLLKNPGTFYYNPATKTILLSCKKNTRIEVDKNPIQILGNKEKFVTDEIKLPEFITKHKCTGTISITRSFENHPTCTFNLVADKDSIRDIRSKFMDRNQKYMFFGIPFRFNNWSENIQARCIYPYGFYEISLSFEGWYQKLINEPIYVNPNRNNTKLKTNKKNTFNIECGIDKNKKLLSKSLAESKKKKDKQIISLSSLAKSSGFNYLGYDFICEYDKPVNPELTTTFSNELSNRLRTKGLYVLYSLSDGVKTKKWKNVGQNKLKENQIIPPVSYSDNMNEIGYKPSRLSWNEDIDEEDLPEEEVQEDTFNSSKPAWKQIINKKQTIITGDENVDVPPNDVGRLKSLDLNYDMSGKTKTRKITTYEGTTVVSEVVETFGFTYLSMDILVVKDGQKVLDGEAAAYWGLVESQKTTYLYDESTGYLLGNDITGFKMCRFKQESENKTVYIDMEMEGIYNPQSKYYQSDSTKRGEKVKELNELKKSYIFNKIPIIGFTRYVLRQFRDYYQDAKNIFPYETYQECDSHGKLITRYLKDPTWVEPMYIGEEGVFFSCFARMENPANIGIRREIKENPPKTDGDKTPLLPDLTTGRESNVYKKVLIFRSKSTVLTEELGFSSSGGSVKDNFIGDDNPDSEDRFTTYITEYSAQDSDFKNSLTMTRTEESQGRPGEATRRPLNYVRDEKDTNNNLTKNIVYKSIYTKTTDSNKKKIKKQKPKDKYKYLLVTEGWNVTDPEQGSVSYNTEYQSEALVGAITDIEIQDMNNNSNINLTTFFNINLLEGTRLKFNWSWDTFLCRIISNTSTIEIKGHDSTGKCNVVGYTQLNLGVDSLLGEKTKLEKIKLPKDPEELPEDIKPDNPQLLTVFNIVTNGKELGERIINTYSRY